LDEGNSGLLRKGPVLFQRGDNHKNTVGSIRNLLFKNYRTRKVEIYVEAVGQNQIYQNYSPCGLSGATEIG
jgi:hypothetical protein